MPRLLLALLPFALLPHAAEPSSVGMPRPGMVSIDQARGELILCATVQPPPDGQWVVGAGADRAVRLWSMADLQLLKAQDRCQAP